MATSDTHSRRSRSVKKPSERTVSVPACLREAHFTAVCCSTETSSCRHIQPVAVAVVCAAGLLIPKSLVRAQHGPQNYLQNILFALSLLTRRAYICAYAHSSALQLVAATFSSLQPIPWDSVPFDRANRTPARRRSRRHELLLEIRGPLTPRPKPRVRRIFEPLGASSSARTEETLTHRLSEPPGCSRRVLRVPHDWLLVGVVGVSRL